MEMGQDCERNSVIVQRFLGLVAWDFALILRDLAQFAPSSASRTELVHAAEADAEHCRTRLYYENPSD